MKNRILILVALLPHFLLAAESIEGLDSQLRLNVNPQLDFGPVCGAVTSKSATFAFGMQFFGDVGQVVLSKNKEFNNAVLSTEVIATRERAGIVKVPVTGLEADTLYYYKVKVNGHAAMQIPQSFRTFPEGQSSFKFTFGNSLRLIRMNQNGMLASIKENPLFFLNTGDLHYADIIGTRVNAFSEAFIRVFNTEAHRRTMAVAPLVYMFDDHDYGPNNSDRTAPGREASLLSYRQVIPHYPLVNEAPDKSIQQVFDVGRARFIMTDLRSNRSPNKDEDGPNKTMMGTEQLQWFLHELKESSKSYAVVFWVSTVPWIQDVKKGADQWGGFAYERRKIADFIAVNKIHNLVILGGDAHSLSADDGTHGDFSSNGNMPNVPELIASPLDNDATSVKGGPFTAGVYRAVKGENVYGLVEVIDNGREVLVRFTGKNNRNEIRIQLEHKVSVNLSEDN